MLRQMAIAAFFSLTAFSQCKDSGTYPTISQIAEVASLTSGLSNDGNIQYIDQVANAQVNTHVAANLWSYVAITRPYKSQRSLRIDLTRPLPGATSLGVITDPEADFHAHYKLDPPDPADGLRLTHPVSEIQLGQSFPSESVRIFFRIGKTQHVLLFGNWAWNTCAPTNGAAIAGGPNTTPATITGTADREWLVTSAPGSVGRLYNIKDKFTPIDRGLYYFDFQVRFRPRP